MTVGFNEISGSASSDGSIVQIASFSVSTGELWYIDGIFCSFDSSEGSFGDYAVRFYVETSGGIVRASSTFDASNDTDHTGSLGQYAYPGDTVVVVEDSDANTGNGVTASAGMRRVL